MYHLLSEVSRGTTDQILSLISVTKDMGTMICMVKSNMVGLMGWSLHKS